MKKEALKEIRLEDYTPPDFLVDTVDLDFTLDEKETRALSRLAVRRNPQSARRNAPLFLNGEELSLKSLRVNGIVFDKQNYKETQHGLILEGIPDEALIEIENTNAPVKNTALSGLYAAGSLLCTQCEPEGFRRITFFPDRADIQSKYRVTLRGNQKKYPHLLSNGNLVKKGKEKNGRHYAVWEDPFRKPCYLFALVAGRLDRRQDHFITKSGRKVLIEIYVDPGRLKETDFALEAIKKAMRWDEERFGLEYDLDRFMIVAVSAFNAGAMENKGLNIFNDSCVLGRAETATDADIAFFERVVGHEYFHNWTGDRITCRDWFQLTLKEGLTVFREQEFCGAMNGRGQERIHTVSLLRRSQFPEDAGAMAHPVRPASYQAIDNFYTATVYGKGAEVCRMIQTLAGEKGFRKGMKLYVKRHDGQASTCEDFVTAMADANDLDLSQFMLWYSQAGTPVLKVRSSYNPKKKEYTLRVRQTTAPTPGQKTKKPFYMPFSVGFLDSKGRDIKGTFVIDLREKEEDFVFLNIDEKPVPSLGRDFSAPVRIDYPYTDAELLLLMAHDSDPVNRWDAGQKLLAKYALSGKKPPRALIEALRCVLKDKKLDAGTKADMLILPSEAELGLLLLAKGKKIDPLEVYENRQRVRTAVASGLADDLWTTYEALAGSLDPLASDGIARGQRSLKNLCLAYLAKVEPETVTPLAFAAATGARNMTDKIDGLNLLVEGQGKAKTEALAAFAKTYQKEPTIMDEWLSAQAAARRPGVLKDVKRLMKHPAFTLKNPNRISALLGVFMGNPFGFHAADGSGYAFAIEAIAKVDALNPQASARLAKPFLRWRDFTPDRQRKMKAQLQKLGKKKLSVNVKEIVTKALKAK